MSKKMEKDKDKKLTKVKKEMNNPTIFLSFLFLGIVSGSIIGTSLGYVIKENEKTLNKNKFYDLGSDKKTKIDSNDWKQNQVQDISSIDFQFKNLK